ncbi:MAG: hypothetical protein NC217_04300 [Muribaculaceae bacterium]|nr:hypothetical protein [Muribaculaceae bacterium]
MKHLPICLLCMVSGLPTSAEYVYMGAGYSFAPMGFDTQTLTLPSGREALMPIAPGRHHGLRLTSLMTSPLEQCAAGGIGFVVVSEEDTTRLTLSINKTLDPVYTHGSLMLNVSSAAMSDSTYTLIEADAPTLHEPHSIFTIAIEDSVLSLSCGRGNTALWKTRVSVPTAIGYFAPHGSKIQVERAMLMSIQTSIEQEYLSQEDIDKQLKESTDPYSGYWTLLDNTLDASYLRPGGDYIFALLPDDDGGYKLLYITGAAVTPSTWSVGMPKGVLKATPLPGLFQLEWIDAEHIPLPGTGTWQFLGTDISQIGFPSLNSALRLHRLRTL